MQIIIGFETDFKIDDNLKATIFEKSKKKLENKALHVLDRQVKQIYAVLQEKIKNSLGDQQELYKQLNAYFKESAKANKEFNKFDGPRNAEIASLGQAIDDVQKKLFN